MGSGHPFPLPGGHFLALHLVATIRHILLHEQSLAHDLGFHHRIKKTHEGVKAEIARRIGILAGNVGFDVGLLPAAYTAQRSMNQDKSMPGRFIATLQEYDPDEDGDTRLCIEDVQEVLDECLEEEGRRDASQLAPQMPVISDAVHQLQKRVAAMSCHVRGVRPTHYRRRSSWTPATRIFALRPFTSQRLDASSRAEMV